MRTKSLWPCEIIIYSKCVWKPCLLIITFTTLLIFVYSLLWPVDKSPDRTPVVKSPLVIRYGYEPKEAFDREKILRNLQTNPPEVVIKSQYDQPVWDADTTAPMPVETTPIHEVIGTMAPNTPEPKKRSPDEIKKRNKKPEQKSGPRFLEKTATISPQKGGVPFQKHDPVFRWCPNVKHGPEEVDCKSLFQGEEGAVEKFKDWKPPCEFSDLEMEKLSQNCSKLHDYFPFEFNFKFPAKTLDYPLAFVLVVEKNAEQVVRLLQSIYRPQNLYCLTYDAHSKLDFKLTIDNIVDCYPNILTPEHHIPINWGGFSILEANINCLKVLHQHSNKWKYVQMLSWNDYPLKSNEEMVEIFKILNGSQDSELKDGEPYRYIKYYQEDRPDNTKVNLTKPVPPGNLYVFKGSLATSLTREFVHFVFHNKIALEYYNYSKNMLIPEEQYWATLIHNLHIGPPGGFPGICKHYFWYRQKRKKPWISRYQMWKELKDPCEGQWTHKSCVFGVGDLWSIRPRPELIAHKIYADFQSATAYCLAQLQFNRTFSGRAEDDVLDYQFYRDLPGVRFQNLADKNQFNCIT